MAKQTNSPTGIRKEPGSPNSLSDKKQKQKKSYNSRWDIGARENAPKRIFLAAIIFPSAIIGFFLFRLFISTNYFEAESLSLSCHFFLSTNRPSTNATIPTPIPV